MLNPNATAVLEIMLTAPQVPRSLLEQVVAEPGHLARLAHTALTRDDLPADLVQPLFDAVDAVDGLVGQKSRALGHAAWHHYANQVPADQVAAQVLTWVHDNTRGAYGAHLAMVIGQLGEDHPVTAAILSAASWEDLLTVTRGDVSYVYPAVRAALRELDARVAANPGVLPDAFPVAAFAAEAVNTELPEGDAVVDVARELASVDLVVALAAHRGTVPEMASLVATRAVPALCADRLSREAADALTLRAGSICRAWTGRDAQAVLDMTTVARCARISHRRAAQALAEGARDRLDAVRRAQALGLPEDTPLALADLVAFAGLDERAAAGRALLDAVRNDAWEQVWTVANSVPRDADLASAAALLTAATV